MTYIEPKNLPACGEFRHIYHVWMVQEGGVRPYPMSRFQISSDSGDPSPLNMSNCPRDVIDNMAPCVMRILGWEYQIQKIIGKFGVGSSGVEIGVDWGDGVARLLSTLPASLHVVDPWLDNTGWASSGQADMDSRHDYVVDRFKNNQAVKIHRQTSDEFFKSCDGIKFDWISVDGNHTESAVFRDLKNAMLHVRKGGLIFGDDRFFADCREDVQRGLARAMEWAGSRAKLYDSDIDPYTIEIMEDF